MNQINDRILDITVLSEFILEPLLEQISLLDETLKEPYLYPHNIRELALVRTKLQEAQFWLNEAMIKETNDRKGETE